MTTVYTLYGHGGFGPCLFLSMHSDPRIARRIARRIDGPVTVREEQIDAPIWEHRGPAWLEGLRGVSVQTSGRLVRRVPAVVGV